jgi:small subunit ribosomal protein S21
MRVEKKHRNESFDSMFKRFRKTVERSKMDYELKRRESYEKPSSVRKRAQEYARKQELKRQQDQDVKRLRV